MEWMGRSVFICFYSGYVSYMSSGLVVIYIKQ